jgi:hypothetical protein
MPDEKALREKARAAIQAGKLPSRPPDWTCSGSGFGATCSVCGLPLTKDEKHPVPRGVGVRAAPRLRPMTQEPQCGKCGAPILEKNVVFPRLVALNMSTAPRPTRCS